MANPGISTEERERRIAAFNDANGNITEAARALNINRTIFDGWCRVEGLKSNPLRVVGKSTLKDLATGEDRLVWVKESLDRVADDEAREAAFRALCETLPRAPLAEAPGLTNTGLCNVYTLTDCHVGMLAWHREGGEDWDITIAERTLVGCFEAMVNAAPRSEVAVVNQLGDFMHYDGLAAITPTSGHHLDADGRFEKMVEAAIRILRRIIDMALAKHGRVKVVLAEGNHDIASSVWLRKLFAALYENEPRLEVLDSALPFYALRHGKTMIAFHHGHLKKNDQLPLLFASQFSKMWGETTRRYAHCGHRHHVEEKEHSGMTVVQHPTLAAWDAYAARGGWIADRAASAITYHVEHGEVGRVTVRPEMLAA